VNENKTTGENVMQTKQIVEAIGLVKAYGETNVVDGVSFSVGEGEIFGILGPNGAGKTTTLEMLEALAGDQLLRQAEFARTAENVCELVRYASERR
jgi:ABC-type multidrug transport system ATPase subunit